MPPIDLKTALLIAFAVLALFGLIWLGIRMYFEEKEKHLDRVLSKMEKGDEGK